MKKLCLALVPWLVASGVHAETAPLLSEARPLFRRAALQAFAEIRRHGIAGLNGTLQDCYGRARDGLDLKGVQFCFAMHVAAIRIDREVIRSLGGEGSSPGMELTDALDMAAPTLHRAGYTDAPFVLQAWIDHFSKDREEPDREEPSALLPKAVP